MIVVFGTSGHAREIAFILKSAGERIDYFVAETDVANKINNINVISEIFFFTTAISSIDKVKIFIGVGDGYIRKKIVQKIRATTTNVVFPNLFYLTTEEEVINNFITLGEGNIFFPGVVLTTNINIGNHNHFNSHSSISHDCNIGDYNTISPGVSIAGNIIIDNYNYFGINSTVIPKTIIGSDIIIGAGATVIKSITERGTYVGTPAKKIK